MNNNFNLFINRDLSEQYPTARDMYTIDNGVTYYVDYYCNVRDIYVSNQNSKSWYILDQENVPIQG
ncbi:hypothetical protein UFOVP455_18 [uncultured Caudovirales phage]|uniref:Uncharacterized protein n=1 Tax=uncultured Caudovirales phage TaxID=2100421 RepID=A0A6J5MBS5_9CAUD|nr:hypothetical protein UFOVP455_18 [uncultured Caudovirales phage]